MTLAVPLEANFLSMFVMIGQNRQAAFEQLKAGNDYKNIDLLLEPGPKLRRARVAGKPPCGASCRLVRTVRWCHPDRGHT
jgi:hypothetical protein